MNGGDVAIGIDDVRDAARRIAPHAVRTPTLPGRGGLDALAGARLHFKCENFQRVGAFKFRGAMNAVLSLSPAERARGIATHSSGNHAAAVALAARIAGTRAFVVMPETAPAAKKAAVAAYGAVIRFCAPTLAAREQAVAEMVAETGAAVVHPYDDWRVIAGQGTAALELLDDAGPLDIVMTPVGGGGLTSGCAIVVKALQPQARCIAAEPAVVDDAARSLASGRIEPPVAARSVADGLLTSLGVRTFAALRRHVDGIVTVPEHAIVAATRLLFERMKLVVEPSAAVPLAALLCGALDARGARVGIVLSGGNLDLDRLPWTGPTATATDASRAT
jgi:threonine dehydratase